MVKGLKFAVVSAIFLFPFVYPHSALSWTALSYQEAVWLCSTGNLQACEVMYAYEQAPSGLRGVRRGPLSTYDFISSCTSGVDIGSAVDFLANGIAA
jgi:hypothetical protein